MDLTRTVVGGLGVTGQAVVRALKTRGHEVIAIDDRPELVSAIATKLEVELVSGTSETEVRKVLSDASSLILSPGIPEHHPINRIAGLSDLEILSELDLGAQWDERPRIAITGTNGKTTVTHLVREMLCQSGLSAIATGNSEVPFADAVQISPEVRLGGVFGPVGLNHIHQNLGADGLMQQGAIFYRLVLFAQSVRREGAPLALEQAVRTPSGPTSRIRLTWVAKLFQLGRVNFNQIHIICDGRPPFHSWL